MKETWFEEGIIVDTSIAVIIGLYVRHRHREHPERLITDRVKSIRWKYPLKPIILAGDLNTVATNWQEMNIEASSGLVRSTNETPGTRRPDIKGRRSLLSELDVIASTTGKSTYSRVENTLDSDHYPILAEYNLN